MPKSVYLRANVLNCAFRGIPYTAPAAVYTALFTASPSDVSPGMEVSGGSYARQLTAFSAPSAPSGSSVSNTADIVFPVASVAWGTVVAFGVFDAPVAGNLLCYGALTAPRSIDVNDSERFPSGQLLIQEQ